MFDKIKNVLDAHTADDVVALIADIKDYVKVRKDNEKDTVIADAKEKINIGDTVLAKYKETEVVGTVTKVSDKSFSIKTVIDGAPKSISRGFHLYAGHTKAD